jgi:hypothetical protein
MIITKPEVINGRERLRLANHVSMGGICLHATLGLIWVFFQANSNPTPSSIVGTVPGEYTWVYTPVSEQSALSVMLFVSWETI